MCVGASSEGGPGQAAEPHASHLGVFDLRESPVLDPALGFGPRGGNLVVQKLEGELVVDQPRLRARLDRRALPVVAALRVAGAGTEGAVALARHLRRGLGGASRLATRTWLGSWPRLAREQTGPALKEWSRLLGICA